MYRVLLARPMALHFTASSLPETESKFLNLPKFKHSFLCTNFVWDWWQYGVLERKVHFLSETTVHVVSDTNLCIGN